MNNRFQHIKSSAKLHRFYTLVCTLVSTQLLLQCHSRSKLNLLSWYLAPRSICFCLSFNCGEQVSLITLILPITLKRKSQRQALASGTTQKSRRRLPMGILSCISLILNLGSHMPITILVEAWREKCWVQTPNPTPVIGMIALVLSHSTTCVLHLAKTCVYLEL